MRAKGRKSCTAVDKLPAKSKGGWNKCEQGKCSGNFESSFQATNDEHEWMWKAISLGELEFAKIGAGTFNFKGVHREFGTPLLAFIRPCLAAQGAFNAPMDKKKKVVAQLIEWLMDSGAESSTHNPPTTAVISFAYGRQEQGGTVQERTSLVVVTASKPTSSVVLELRDETRRLAGIDNRWAQTNEIVDHLFAQIKKFAVQTTSAQRVQVPEVVVDAWERIFQRGLVEGDVHIMAKGDQPVRAYAHVLEESSPVLKAMLSSTMCEGHAGLATSDTARMIRVEESVEAVRILVELMCVGSLPPCDPGVSAGHLLEVLKMCHRWQLISLGGLLERHVARMVHPENIEAMLEVAVLLGADALRRACVETAKDCEKLQQKLRAGELMPAVAAELRKALGLGEPATKKRRTTL